jgi:hypothetical protein
VSLLELSPSSVPRSLAFTRSDRGGLRSGLAGAGVGNEVSGFCEFPEGVG